MPQRIPSSGPPLPTMGHPMPRDNTVTPCRLRATTGMSANRLTGLIAIILASAGSPLQAAEPLERELVGQAPDIITRLKERHYANVGLLKFLVTRDGQRFSDNVGTLNLQLAKRLEIALILANDPKDPVGIIEDANAVAHRIPGANHLSRA